MQDDAISRQEVLETISELNAISFYEAQEDSKECYCEIRQAVENIPSITPQEPCDDAISREDAIRILRADTLFVCTGDKMQAISDIADLPPVTQKSGKWIPVSERLPEEYGEYLVTWKTNDSSTPFISVCEYETSYEYDVEKHRFNGEWLVDDYILVHSDYEVIAWMPLPEPYEPQEREDKE